MKKNIFFAATFMAMACLVYAGGNETKKPSSSNQEPMAWVPKQENHYDFRVVETEAIRSLTVSIDGTIGNASILSIINLRGEEQFRVTVDPVVDNYSVQIDLSELEHGVYFLKVDSQDEIRMKRLVIR
jgi:hypothetical protein